MPNPIDYKSTLVNTGDALPHPKWQKMVAATGGTTYIFTLTPPANTGVASMVMIQYISRPPDDSGLCNFTMDGTGPVGPTPGITESIGAGSDQMVMDKGTVIRSLDGATEVRAVANVTGTIVVSFW